MEYSWIIFLVLVVVLYSSTIKHLYRRWRRAKAKKQTPSPLLGVVYPRGMNDKKDDK